MKIKKGIFIGLGTLTLALGCVAAVVPLLPTTPFLVLTLYFYGRSSEKLHTWFIGTKLYKNNLESFVQKRGMTVKTKLKVIITLSIAMAFAFYMMRNVLIGRICLVVVWVGHILYFFLRVKTIPDSKKTNEKSATNNIEITEKNDDMSNTSAP